MFNKTILPTVLGLLVVSACSDGTAPHGAEKAESETEEMPASGYAQSIEKSHQVEEQVREAAEQQKRTIEEESGGG